jgi:hypothetical protein
MALNLVPTWFGLPTPVSPATDHRPPDRRSLFCERDNDIALGPFQNELSQPSKNPSSTSKRLLETEARLFVNLREQRAQKDWTKFWPISKPRATPKVQARPTSLLPRYATPVRTLGPPLAARRAAATT